MFSRRSGGGAKTRTQPSHYSPVPFHLIRLLSFLASLVVSAIMFYFMYHLRHDHFKIPWTFLLLMSVSLLTLATLTITNILHCCHVLPPRLSLLLNIPLLTIWCLSFALLTWNMSGTLTHVCSTANWGNSDGVMICRIYKALFSFTVVGLFAAFLAVVLDVKTRRKQTRMGNYAAMGSPRGSRLGEKGDLGGMQVGVEPLRGESPAPERSTSPAPLGYTHGYTDSLSGSRGQREAGYEGYDGRAGAEYNGHPVGQYAQGPRWGSQTQMRAEDFGYGAPSDQTRYDGYVHDQGR